MKMHRECGMWNVECGVKNQKIIALVGIFVLFGLVFNALLFAEEKEFKKGCRGCHKEMIEKWDTVEIKHYPYREEKCESCHSLEHKKFTAEAGKPCLICHDLASSKIKKAHFSTDLTGVNCFQCHYTHASDKKGMLKESVHSPFEAGMCEICHNVGGDGRLEVKKELKKICLVCHANLTSKEDKVVHAAYEMMECVDCHNPHTAVYPRLLNKKISEICFDCHDKELAKKHPYDVRPSNKIILEKSNKIWFNYNENLTCVSCHNPHAANQLFLLKESLKDGKLCYICHKRQENIKKE